MPLRFAIHGHCLVCKVKQRHWLGEADFCCVSSFAFVTIFLAKDYNYIFEFVKVMSGHGLRKITSSLRNVVQVLVGHFTIFQSHGLSGWSVPKIVKSCLNLSKLRPKYNQSFFSGTLCSLKYCMSVCHSNSTTTSFIGTFWYNFLRNHMQGLTLLVHHVQEFLQESQSITQGRL